MPLVEYVSPQAADPTSLLSATTRAVVETLGKSERSVMVQVRAATGCLGGSRDPSCSIRVSHVGKLDDHARAQLARQLTWIASEHLTVHEERVFVIFDEVARDAWSVGGRLLAERAVKPPAI